MSASAVTETTRSTGVAWSTAPLARLFAYRLVSRCYFHLPVLLVYLYLAGHGIVFIEVVLAAYGLAILFGSGLARRFEAALGLTRALALGEIIKAGGVLGLAFGRDQPVALVVAQVALGFGYAVTVGAENALVARLAPSKDDIGRIQGATQAWIFGVIFMSGTVGAVLFEDHQRLVFLLSLVACVVAAMLAATISAPTDEVTPKAPALVGSVASEPTPSAVPAADRGRVVAWSAYYVIVRGIGLGCFVGVLPYLLFVEVQASLRYFGALLGAFNIAAFFAARVFSASTVGAGPLRVATLLSLAGSLAVFAVTASVWAGLAAIALLGIGVGAARPLTQKGLAVLPQPALRSVNARMEQMTGLANAIVLIGAGALLRYQSSSVAMWTLAGAAVVGAVALVVIGDNGGRKKEESDELCPSTSR